MRISRLSIKNFRLLRDVSLLLEGTTTAIVGRNNSGKTSLTELFRRLLSGSSPRFRLEDFSLAAIEGFWTARELRRGGRPDEDVIKALPAIELRIFVQFDPATEVFGSLSDCIVDLDPNCNEALIVVCFEPRAENVAALLDSQAGEPGGLPEETKHEFFRRVREAIGTCYQLEMLAVDPSDESNRKAIGEAELRAVLSCDFISAQRGLDDVTAKDRDVLGRVLEVLFASAAADTADPNQKLLARELETAVATVQGQLDQSFREKLGKLLPTFQLFGYPGLRDPAITTETTLDVKSLLVDHTKVKYRGVDGIHLPETYSGLGIRNLIFMLLQLHSFFQAFKALSRAPAVHLVFIEEPEAHLHPQMQEVFIRQLGKIARTFEADLNAGEAWPVQFVVTTHSSHVANEARFEWVRYFLPVHAEGNNASAVARVKDLRHGLRGVADGDREFLHKYLTLTRCDLFFADKAILVEGSAERLALPRMIEKVDSGLQEGERLSSQYISILEVGGAFAHVFFPLLDFLELPALVITDIDSVRELGGEACVVSEGQASSNQTIRSWFGEDCAPTLLVAKTPEAKTTGLRRLAYQVPEQDGGPCGRTFEDAFILANSSLFGTTVEHADLSEGQAREIAGKLKKSDFGLRFGIKESDWKVPRYIEEGLKWLSKGGSDPEPESAIAAGAEPLPEHGAH